MEKNKVATIAVVALAIGLVGGFCFGKSRSDDYGMYQMPHGLTANNHGGMHDTMAGMMSGLEGKNGDEFDKAFLSEMIVHHEGAVMMANAALQRAKHAEIKQMAQAIITTQTQEITQMKDWLKSWYSSE